MYTIHELIDKGVAGLLTNPQWLVYIVLSYENKITYLEKLGVISPPVKIFKLNEEFSSCHV